MGAMKKHFSKINMDKSVYQWPTYPAPPIGTKRSSQLLLGVAYLTVAAVYIAYLVNRSGRLDLTRLTIISALFALFILSIFAYLKAFEVFWRRLVVVLLQIALISSIVIVGGGNDSLSTLYFIIIPMIFLAFNFLLSCGLLLLCLCAMFLANLTVLGLNEALSNLLPYGGGFAFFAAVSTALIQQQRERQRTEQLLTELEQAHQQLHAYAAQVEDLAVAKERNRIARDIHDSLGHYLTAMTMQLQAAAKLIELHPERAVETIGKIEKMARDSLAELRRAVAALRDSPLDSMLLGDAIKELTNNLTRSGIVAEFEEYGEAKPLSPQVKTALFRVAQEGITNVSKHSNASSVIVKLTYKPEYVDLEIDDNGIGQQYKSESGYGLIGLHERLNLLGGSLEAGNKTGGGYRLSVTVPYASDGLGRDHG